ncbi:alpha/beta hydrolase [Pseudenhygromyxa sp. WMMC2535]|uniref:esterase/lipase family protein n=1 Tax=Pseudenhygromyxa sp. WMMC2535 TaxID=2712867 RepID=UPI001555201A|nr:alpha/beta hydrolase [Pseudenhygromyxa sp. WMMC2535]NVB43377.1 alpha/beta hydrolase [Pseudenhygromyxa sp. WMMC2535]
MNHERRSHVDDLRGATRLAIEATRGVTDLVEEMHRGIAAGPRLLGRPLEAPTRLVTGLVYGGIRGVTGVVGASIDLALAQLARLLGELGEGAPRSELEIVLSALNGVLGDYLAETQNPLAIEMSLRAAVLEAKGRILLMVPGLCMSESQWLRKDHDHGEALAEVLDASRVDLRYNSGLHVSSNGRELSERLERLVDGWPVPVEAITIVAHSMGGLVSRSACWVGEQTGARWPGLLDKLVFLGTPHHGAPLERAGNWFEVIVGELPYAAPMARLGRIRSAGVTDLRYGNVLDEHWRGVDRFARGPDRRAPLPLPVGPSCYALAGSGVLGEGDGLVSVASALGRHDEPTLCLEFAEQHTATFPGVGHMELLADPRVYAQMVNWLDPGL